MSAALYNGYRHKNDQAEFLLIIEAQLVVSWGDYLKI
jgi:hypothetical protein